ncbi:MAG: ABC transporter ATP-binding protein [Desulfopila sp.]
MISCELLQKTYHVGFLPQKTKVALNRVNLAVQRNEVFGIIGLNGAGKSSLLKILMGFVRPDSGTAHIGGGQPAGELEKSAHIGYLPEHPALYRNLTITEHLQFGCRCGGIDSTETNRRIAKVLDKVGLAEVASTPIKRFSKGMTQRAALAYAILLDPEVLILDEPMSGLDPLGRQLVIDIIDEYRQKGTTILFSSHILTDVERICDRIGIMHQGELISTLAMPRVSRQSHQKPAGTTNGKTRLETIFLETVQKENHASGHLGSGKYHA